MPGVAKPSPHIPADYAQPAGQERLWLAARQRDSILREWSRRYESKSEPKP